MSKNVTVKINEKKVLKKLEQIALEKYLPNNQYSNPDPQCIRLGETTFSPINENMPFGIPRETLPYNYRRIRCSHCKNIITVPIGYNHCPNCGSTVYVDKETASLK